MLVFFKRYRMQFDLRDVVFSAEELQAPDGFKLHPWRNTLLAGHAEAKYLSFYHELDATVFPCLGKADGCSRLMREISRRKGFVPDSTWLLTCDRPLTGTSRFVGTVQGISDNPLIGLIQNIGIAPAYRGRGLGSVIVRNALAGFQRAGARLATLEVTAQNLDAIRLYKRLGFTIQKHVYKSVDVPMER